MKTTAQTFKHNQTVTIKDNYEYALRLKGMKGIIVKISDYGVNVYLSVFPTLSYQDNIFFFPFTAIK